MHPMRLVFAGTPDFALPSFVACRDSGAELVAVYTQPDRPAGRGRKLAPSPIKRAALEAGVSVLQPESLRTAAARAELAALAPDLIVVVAYGLILPRAVLAIPPHGCWNIHASLLPRWRGAAPIQRAILAGDGETGVGLMQMEKGLDTGAVLAERRMPIDADDTGGTLHDKLAALGAELLAESLARVMAGEALPATPQAQSGVTYAHKLDKAEARLDFRQPARALERAVRAFRPWPIAEAELAGERLRIHAARALDQAHAKTPGTIVAAHAGGLDIACAEGVLRVLALQREGGRRITIGDFLNARPELKRGPA